MHLCLWSSAAIKGQMKVQLQLWPWMWMYNALIRTRELLQNKMSICKPPRRHVTVRSSELAVDDSNYKENQNRNDRNRYNPIRSHPTSKPSVICHGRLSHMKTKGRFTYEPSPSTSSHSCQHSPRSPTACRSCAELSLSVYVNRQECLLQLPLSRLLMPD